MKNFILILVMLITGLTMNSLNAQGGWSLQTNPSTGRVVHVEAISADAAWINLTNDKVLHTTDAGLNWNQVTLDAGTAIWSKEDAEASQLSFINATTGWVVKCLGTSPSDSYGVAVYKTTNGGTTWQKKIISQIESDAGNQIQFVDANNGWLMVRNDYTHNSTYFKTTDGGATWISTSGEGIFHFVDANNGWAIQRSSGKVIYHTTNGGTTWTSQFTFTDPTIGELNAIQFTDLNNGWIIGNNGKIFKTSNGGINWTQVTNTGITSQHRNTCIYFMNSTTGWIGTHKDGENVFVLHTTNGGISWSSQQVPAGSDLKSISYWDENNGWHTSYLNQIGHYSVVNAYPSVGIVGDATSGWETDIAMNTTDGITYKITAYTFKNGGAKFRQDNAWTINWGSNQFPSGIGTQDGPNIPVIAGTYNVTFNRNTGAYNFTDPANTDWKLQTNPVSTNAAVGKIQFVSATKGWISISKGGLLHTTDGGTTWAEVPLDLPQVMICSMIDPAFNICFISPSIGWVIKTFGTEVFLDSNGAVIYKTTDGGLSWQKTILSQVEGDTGGQIQFIDENNGFCSVYNANSGLGKYYKTSDGGTTWNLMPSDGSIGILYQVDLDNAWGILGVASDNPPYSIIHSTNGMTSFTEQKTDDSPGAFWAIQFTDLNHGWVVGEKGKILKTVDGEYWDPVKNTGITADYTCKSVYFINATTGWIGAQIDDSNNKNIALSNTAIVLHTTDGGASWTTQTTPTLNPYSIFFWDENNGWLTSDDNKIASFTGPLGVKENAVDKFITIYPNPNNGTFYFSLKNTNSIIKVEIFNLTGQKVYEASNVEKQISNEVNFAPQSKGVYLIKINDGENNYTKKILIQ